MLPARVRAAPRLGGAEGLRRFVETCRSAGIRPYAWTNNAQAYSSPLGPSNPRTADWWVRMEDTRLAYGGAYTNVLAVWSFRRDEPRNYWVDSLKKIKAETGLDGYLFDSFYNLAFMPVDYADRRPTTQWRQLLGTIKELQDAAVHFLIESFGPFGQTQHGCPKSYNEENLFACYKIGLGTGSTTIPSNTAGAAAATNTLRPRLAYTASWPT